MEEDAERRWREPPGRLAGPSEGVGRSPAGAPDWVGFIGYEAADPSLHVLQWDQSLPQVPDQNGGG